MKLIPTTKVMRFSLLAFIATLALGLLSMGFLGIGLYYVVSPILDLKFQDLDSLHGDWVWPALILSGMFWSFGFLFAGWLYLYLEKHRTINWSKPILTTIYIIVLLLWALIIWAGILIGRPA